MGQCISVCKNVIASNNRREWVDSLPPIRVSSSKAGKVIERGHTVGIVDKDGNIVATIVSSTDGKPVISCGAKVGIFTEYDIVRLK